MKPSNDTSLEETDQTPMSTPPELPRYPPGYHFVPTDRELIQEYLMKKVNNKPIPISDIKDINLKQHNPMTITAVVPKIEENAWYIFTPRDRKYPNGTRPDRAANGGYWRPTASDKEINHEGITIGFKKGLVFYEGEARRGTKTRWIMQEYRLNQAPHSKTGPEDMKLDDWVLCRIYETDQKFTTRGKRKAVSEVISDDVAVVNNHEDAVYEALSVMENSPTPPVLQEEQLAMMETSALPPVLQKEHYRHKVNTKNIEFHPLLPQPPVNDNHNKTGFGFDDLESHMYEEDYHLQTQGFACENPVLSIDEIFNDMGQNEQTTTAAVEGPKWISTSSAGYNTAAFPSFCAANSNVVTPPAVYSTAALPSSYAANSNVVTPPVVYNTAALPSSFAANSNVTPPVVYSTAALPSLYAANSNVTAPVVYSTAALPSSCAANSNVTPPVMYNTAALPSLYAADSNVTPPVVYNTAALPSLYAANGNVIPPVVYNTAALPSSYAANSNIVTPPVVYSTAALPSFYAANNNVEHDPIKYLSTRKANNFH